mmetsp:Transcript_5290/g.14843  ORF Transcript_5290/g.14843 Transcript_5290/m.14843 type:complete len:427 (+) Transcript_5290:96-1376(+)
MKNVKQLVITMTMAATTKASFRHVPLAQDARCLTDGVALVPCFVNVFTSRPTDDSRDSSPVVIMPWIGFGTYKLGQSKAREAVLQAFEAGYRHIDTAFIYSRQRTEIAVGKALQETNLRRQDIFVTSKHWRTYHGYDPSWECLNLSLERLQLNYLDLWLMHWPGPAWKKRSNNKTDGVDDEESNGEVNNPWRDADSQARNSIDMQQLRTETWRAMEDAYLQGKVRAIGVCNFSLPQLEALVEQCRIQPMVCQVEYHPLCAQQQLPLLQYCQEQGIIVQAYASLGGQDTSAEQWEAVLGQQQLASHENDSTTAPPPTTLLTSPPVTKLARALNYTPAQILLRWALEQNCVILPKTSHWERLRENAQVLDCSMTPNQVAQLSEELRNQVIDTLIDTNNCDDDEESKERRLQELTRLCWRGDRFRLLDF